MPLFITIAFAIVGRLAGEQRTELNGMPSSHSSIDNDLTGSAFGVDFEALSPADLKGLGRLAEEILDDPLALQQLSDRVYRLMQDDLHRQQERQRGCGRSRNGR